MNRILAVGILAFSPLLLTACASTQDDKRVGQVKLIPIEVTGQCNFKGNVSSEAPYFGVFTQTTENKLITLAKESAVRLGAGYLVLDEPVEVGYKYTLQGKAYSCP
ncbi:MAG: hypothetical protein PHX61_07100 [Alphaproteobacteria bacterium]|nr:hypothetical protein [Alphaproteobacteria bacterium]OIN85383.1 MAG: hypothetical protein AUJ12_09540 [Alphaproteobacteria bacterium CG1_02_46_17]